MDVLSTPGSLSDATVAALLTPLLRALSDKYKLSGSQPLSLAEVVVGGGDSSTKRPSMSSAATRLKGQLRLGVAQQSRTRCKEEKWQGGSSVAARPQHRQTDPVLFAASANSLNAFSCPNWDLFEVLFSF